MPPLAELDDSLLLAHIAEHGAAARAEMQEFYTRHVRYLYAVARKQCERLGFDAQEVEDLVHDTFQRAFDRARSYRPSQSSEPEQRRRWTRAWLGAIARNLILAALGARLETPASDVLEQTAHRDRDSSPPSSRNPQLSALRHALDQLDDREQDVLRVSALYYRAGERHQRLPNEVSRELAERWNTSNENIRAIRSRALKRLVSLTTGLMNARAAAPLEETGL